MADFSYYYGDDAEQFNFFRLPKLLVRDKRFDGLSSEAKILYGVLLDRMALSAQNGWLDDDNRIYIIYTTREVMREFGCSERKAITLMGELDTRKGIGLIEKRRQGLGKPNIIYVKNFNSVIRDDAGGGTSGETGARGGGSMGAGLGSGNDALRETRVAGDGSGQERRGHGDWPEQGWRCAGDGTFRKPDACRVIPGLPDGRGGHGGHGRGDGSAESAVAGRRPAGKDAGGNRQKRGRKGGGGTLRFPDMQESAGQDMQKRAGQDMQERAGQDMQKRAGQ